MATVTITTTPAEPLLSGQTIRLNLNWDADVTGFSATDIVILNLTNTQTLAEQNFTTVSPREYTVEFIAPDGDGEVQVIVPADAVNEGNPYTAVNFDFEMPLALTVTLAGTTTLEQGAQTTLQATVVDANGNTPSDVTYMWTASRGQFIGQTNGASVVYLADFTDAMDVDVTVTCAVTSPANDSPTVATAALTAMGDLGITGQLVNIHATVSNAVANNTNNIIFAEGQIGTTLETGSDLDLSTDLHIYRMRWDNRGGNTRLLLNQNGAGNLGTYFSGNTTQSVYLIFQDGTYFEVDSAQYDGGGGGFARWVLTDTALIGRLNAWDGTENLLVGIADADAIGFRAGLGRGTATVTATLPMNITAFLSTEAPKIYAGETTAITIRFSAAVTGLSANDFTVTNGTRGALTGQGQNWVLTVTAGAAGTMNIALSADAVPEGNLAAARDFTVHALTVPAAPTIDSITPNRTSAEVAITAPTDTGGTAITGYRYRRAEGATIPNSATWTDTGSTDTRFTIPNLDPNTAYAVAVQAVNAQGNGAASAVSTFTTLALPTVRITVGSSFLIHNGSTPVTMVWSEAPTDFAANDVSVDVGAFTHFAMVNATTWTGTVTAPGTGAGDIVLTIRENSITEGNAETTASVAYGASTLSIETIDEQFIVIGTEDYALLIDILGNPDTVDVKGHMEGFFSDWDAAMEQLAIKSDAVTRLIKGVTWDLEVIKNTEILTPKIKYNVIPAPPILESLPTIHFYRGVPIYLDIIIANIPSVVVPNARLRGLKSELREYGVNVQGEIPVDATFSFNSGNVTLIIPSDTGETADMHDYPYIIEAGSPPAIPIPRLTPKGHYAEMTLDDVNHALGYEWTLESGDDATWNFFNDDRNLIDPGQIEIELGNLSATVTFPNVTGAVRYAYMLESENTSGGWVPFTGTLVNNMITTYIPDLIEGEEYRLRLRVGSPWQGSPVSITFTAGRLAYCVSDNDADSALYIFSTGTVEHAIASTVKKILLPTGNEQPAGVSIRDGKAYVFDHGDDSIYVFSLDTEHNTRATAERKFFVPSGTTIHSGNDYDLIDIYEDEVYLRINREDVITFDVDTPNGQNATQISEVTYDDNTSLTSQLECLVVTDELVFTTTGSDIDIFPRSTTDGSTVSPIKSISAFSMVFERGLSVVGDIMYLFNSGTGNLLVFNHSRMADGDRILHLPDESIKEFLPPPGCDNPTGLKVAS